MLVALSDLHLVDGTAGDHSPTSAALRSVLLSEVLPLARANQAREIKLLLLGDIFDLLRSEQWFGGHDRPLPAAERPWGAQGRGDVGAPRTDGATERLCLDILGRLPADGRREGVSSASILHQNWATLELIRAFPELARRELGRDLPVEVIYVPGNHDRLVHVYPGVRDEVARILGIAPAGDGKVPEWCPRDAGGAWWFPVVWEDGPHGVVARHGHQFDPWNYAGGSDLSRAAHTAPVLGDVFATEFAVKIPWLLSAMRERWSGVSDAAIDGLRAMHDVRPASDVLDWLLEHIARGAHAQLRRALDAVVTIAIKTLFDVDLVLASRGVDRRWDLVRAAMTRPGLRQLSHRAVDVLPNDNLLPFLLGRSMDAGRSGAAQARAASREPALREGRHTRFVVYGHTHAPTQVPLGEIGGRDAFYVNTGTWRERVFRALSLDGRSGFARLNQLTYAVFYRGDEDVEGKRPGTTSFEVRTAVRRKERTPAGATEAVLARA